MILTKAAGMSAASKLLFRGKTKKLGAPSFFAT